MKRIIFGILWALISMNAFSYEADFYVDGIGYTVLTLTGDLTCAVSDYDDSVCEGNITIPETVTYQGRILKVVEIGTSAFNGAKITSITLPKNMGDIGSYAFNNCKYLKTVTFEGGCGDIDNSAFSYCESLTSITIPEGCKSMGSHVFEGCTSLSSVVLPNSCTRLSGTFCNCPSLKYVNTDNVTELGYQTFYNCESLTSIVLNTKDIPSYCFYGCTSLKSVETKDGLGFSSIDSYAFEDCISLSSIKFREPIIMDSNQFNNYQVESGQRVKEMYDSYGNRWYILDAIEIAGGAFYYCKSLSSIILPNGTAIEYGAFYYCPALKSVTIYDNYRIFENLLESPLYCFYECGIEELTTNNTNIISKFKYLTEKDNLKRIVSDFTINKERINWSDFKNLEELVSLSSEPPHIDDTFSNKQYIKLKVTVPTEALAAYQQADVWKIFWNLQGGATGINSPTVNNEDSDAPIYDISGRKITESIKGQVYIKNGKKFIAR